MSDSKFMSTLRCFDVFRNVCDGFPWKHCNFIIPLGFATFSQGKGNVSAIFNGNKKKLYFLLCLLAMFNLSNICEIYGLYLGVVMKGSKYGFRRMTWHASHRFQTLYFSLLYIFITSYQVDAQLQTS